MKKNDFLLLTGGFLLLNELLKPSDKRAIGSVKSEMDELIRYTITTKSNANKKAVIETVDAAQAIKIQNVTNTNLTGYQHTVDAYAIKHILRQHGNPDSETPRGLVAVTIDDFYLIPAIIKNADKITSGKTKQGLAAIIYEKKVGSIFYYVEEIRTGRKELAATTLYKKRAAK